MDNAKDLEFASVAKLMKAAQLYSSGVFPQLTHQSLPIPVVVPEGIYVAFLYCHAEILETRKGLQIWAPSYLAYLDAKTAEFDKVAAISPKVFGLDDPMDKPLGTYLTPVEQNSDEFLSNKIKIFQAYDQVMRGYLESLDPQQTETLKYRNNFTQLFRQISEACLLDYYHILNHSFFEWVGETHS